jgi:hypothetical protein
LKAELAAIEAESIGWQPLGEGAYLHVGKPEGGKQKQKDTHFVYIKSLGRNAESHCWVNFV